MRNGQNKRMRGRNRKGGGGHHHHQNPLSRMYESNGPDVKIRGTASHVAEKYLQLARDAQSSGDPVAAENYYQHAEHYFRLIAAAQEQFRQSPSYYQQQGEPRGNVADDGYDEDGNEQPPISGEPFAPRESQPFYPREQQQPQHGQPQHNQPQHSQPQHNQPQHNQPQHSQPQHNQPQHNQPQHNQPQHNQPQHNQPQHNQPQHNQPRTQHFQPSGEEDVERLPSFITGGQPQQPTQQGQGPNNPNGPNGPHDPGGPNGPNGYDGSADRFPLHRRRRRHRGPRDHSMQGDNDAPMPSGPRPIDD
ncbi:MAG: DUF4167 domain-containing protein [Xanthobacteraceae bacterium]|jgi:hypothetical protein